MARTKVDNKLNVVIGTKAQVEADNTIPENAIVVVTDEELTASDIPNLEISKITGLQTALDDKLDKNNAITAGTKAKITYDTKGLVTGGSDLVASDIPNLNTSKLTTGTLGIARGGTGRTDGYAVGVVETRASVLTKIWAGNQAQYDAIGTKDANTLYFITE